MLYQNLKTGQLVKTTGRVSGRDWVLVETPKKPSGRKKSGEGA